LRIELNSGGLSNGVAISDYRTNVDLLIKKSNRMVSAFQTVTSRSYNMNGGVGTLQGAVDKIENRIRSDINRTSQIESVERKSSEFIELALRTDIEVSANVTKSKNEFYNVNPWSKPPPPPEEKNWYQKAGEWLCEKGKQIVDGIKNTVVDLSKTVIDSLNKAWNNVVEWYKENKELICQVVVEVAIGAAVIGLAALTGGASLAITVAITAGVGAAIGAAGGAVEYYAENGTLKGAGSTIIGETAKGFMSGAISGYVGGQVGIAGKAMKLGRGATTIVGAVTNAAASSGSETIHSLANGGGITDKEKKEIVKNGITGFITGGIGSYKGYGKDTAFDKLKHNKNYKKNAIEKIKDNAVKNMREYVPNSIYNAQEAIRDLSAFNKYLTRGIIKDKFFDDVVDGVKEKILDYASDFVPIL